MDTLMKQLIGCLAATLATLAAGNLAGLPAVGGLAASVPIMTGLLLIWDAYKADGVSCYLCGRDNLAGRHMELHEWYRDCDLDCRACGRRLSAAGDRLYEAPAGGTAP